MNIELDDDAVDKMVYQRLIDLEETFPEDQKLSKAIKRILSNIMIPNEWEELYEQDFVQYHNKNRVVDNDHDVMLDNIFNTFANEYLKLNKGEK